MKTALVIGAAGFIGGYLCQGLKEEMAVACVDNLTNGSAKRFKLLNPDLELVNKDICQVNDNELPKLDYIFDLAYINGTRQFYTRGADILKVANSNLLSSISLAESFSAKLIYFSTPEVFGDTDIFPTPENAPFRIPDITNPRWSYSIGKIYGESLLHNTYISNPSLKYNIVRPNNAYGPYDRYHVIPDLLNRLKSGVRHLEVRGDRNATRSYCFIHDMVKQIIAVAKTAPNGETYNLGNACETSLEELANLLVYVSDSHADLSFSDAPQGSPLRRIPCTKKIDDICNIPKTLITDGLSILAKEENYDPYTEF